MRRTTMEAAVYLTWARLTLRKRALAEIRRQWGSKPDGRPERKPDEDLELAVELGRTTLYAASRLPFRCSCLVQAVALTAMLRRRGISADLKFGVRPGREGAGISAHAWVEYGQKVVLDSSTHRMFIPFGHG